MKKVKNGKIEFMRFIFCLSVIFYHFNNRVEISTPENFSFFAYGSIGVEFFFLVSGYLMAKGIKKYKQSNYTIGKSTYDFMSKKYLAIFPYHIVAFVLTLVVSLVINPYADFKSGFEGIVSMLPNFFLVQQIGISSTVLVVVEWYISSMLIAMVILFPMMMKFDKNFTRIVLPVASILIIAYMYHNDGRMDGGGIWLFNNSILKANVRALVEIAFGTFLYEFSLFLQKVNFKKIDRALLTIIEIASYLFVIYYACNSDGFRFQMYAFYALALAILLNFSGVTYFNNFFNNKFFYTLGKLSLPIYLSQNFVFLILIEYIPDDYRIRSKLLITLALCFVTAIVIQLIGNVLSKLMNKKQISLMKTAM